MPIITITGLSDVAYPAPEPIRFARYRAGQVWLTCNDKTVRILAVEDHETVTGIPCQVMTIELDGERFEYVCGLRGATLIEGPSAECEQWDARMREHVRIEEEQRMNLSWDAPTGDFIDLREKP